MDAVLPAARYADETTKRNFTEAVVDRLRAIPGVEFASAINIRPSHVGNVARPIEIEGQPLGDPAQRPEAGFRAATPDLFDALRIPIARGRGFTPADRARFPAGRRRQPVARPPVLVRPRPDRTTAARGFRSLADRDWRLR